MNVFIGVIYAYKGLLLVSDRNGIDDDDGDNDEDHGNYDDESLAKRLSKVLWGDGYKWLHAMLVISMQILYKKHKQVRDDID